MTDIVKELNITLKLRGDYDKSKSDPENFREFYLKNKRTIFKSIIQLFNRLLKTDEKTLLLTVTSTLRGISSESVFRYGLQDSELLMSEVLPYFEDIEDYETCNKIIKLYKRIKNRKL